MAAANAARNGFEEERAKFVCADVFEYLRTLRDAGETFDLVILDPPKFASSHYHVDRASRACRDINLNGLRLLAGRASLRSPARARSTWIFSRESVAALLRRRRRRLGRGPLRRRRGPSASDDLSGRRVPQGLHLLVRP